MESVAAFNNLYHGKMSNAMANKQEAKQDKQPETDAAKRLWILLGAILKQYEARFGTLEIDRSAIHAGATGGPAEAGAGGDGGEPSAKSS